MKYFLILLLLVCATSGQSSADDVKIELNGDDRKNYIQRAEVWRPMDIPAANILAGPQNEIASPLNSLVECEYIEPKEKLTGRWPKFLCKTNKGHVIRVKYGPENKEIYAEAAASRLFWALGFFADEVYPVQVRCRKCPENPFKPEDGKRATFIFKDAIVERNFPGETLEEKEDQGWTWKELEGVQGEVGGATRTHLDALRLLAVFVQHSDAKPDNQRLACFKQDIKSDSEGKPYCAKPILMIQDLGATFGSGIEVMNISRMDVKAWGEKPVWNTAVEARNRQKNGTAFCIGTITSSHLAGEEGLTDPIITEEGRKFLAGLLSQLSDRQIRDLFKVARVEQLDETIEEGGVARKVTIEDWVAAFKKRRAEIQERTCPQTES
jgi:hypothetical protein